MKTLIVDSITSALFLQCHILFSATIDNAFGSPKKVVAKLGTPLTLACLSGKVDAWYHRKGGYDLESDFNDKATPIRCLRRRSRRLVIIPRRSDDFGLYKCGRKNGWDYEIVTGAVRRRRDYDSDKRCLELPQREYYNVTIVVSPVGVDEIFECGNGSNNVLAPAGNYSYKWYRIHTNKINETEIGTNRTLKIKLEKDYYYECRYGTKDDLFFDRFFVAEPDQKATNSTEIKLSCKRYNRGKSSWYRSVKGDLANFSDYKELPDQSWGCPTESQTVRANRPCYAPQNEYHNIQIPICNCGHPSSFTFLCGLLSTEDTIDPICWSSMLNVRYQQVRFSATKRAPTSNAVTTAFPSIATTSPTSKKHLVYQTVSSHFTSTTIPTPTLFSIVNFPKSSVNLPVVISTGVVASVVLAAVIITIAFLYLRRRRFDVWAQTAELDNDDLTNNAAYRKPIDVLLKRNTKKHIIIEGIRLDASYKIPKESVTLLKALGEGCFGYVMEGIAANVDGITGSMQVAVKVSKARDRKSIQDLAAEVNVWTRIGKHKNVISLIGITHFQTSSGPMLWVIMEYASNGCLHKYMRAKRFGRSLRDIDVDTDADAMSYVPPDEQTVLSSCDMFRYALDVARGMEHLAMQECLHRDLAARNVLVCDMEVLKVSDFGMAKDIHYFDYYRKKTPKNLVPFKWTAPEALLHRVFTEASDVWSFGILLWEIATLGSAPYPGVPAEDLYNLLTEKGYRMRKPLTCSRAFYDIMLKCWALDPIQRPKFGELVTLLEEGLAEAKITADCKAQQEVSSGDTSVIRNAAERPNFTKRQLSSQDSGVLGSPMTPLLYNSAPVFDSPVQSNETSV